MATIKKSRKISKKELDERMERIIFFEHMRGDYSGDI